MTPQESQMLSDLARKISQTQLQEKDPEAEALLQQSLGHDQDALYKLAQTVLVQNIALDQARQQILHLQEQPPPSRVSSFLGGLLGHKDPAPAPAPPPPQPQYQTQYQPVPQQYVQQPVYVAQPQYAQQQQPAAAGGGSSFLKSAATTAAGVAAGALAFEGVESLLHMGHGGFGGGGFGGDYAGGGFGGGGYGEAPREEIVNNYYGSPEGGGNAGYVSGPDEQPQGGFDVSGQDEQPQGGSLDDTSYDSSSDDSGSFGGDDNNFA